MAKQTFTTGQVLTAAEMTTLQTNDYNQTVTAKTANYVLVAADAGTRITMSNAGATTITVNTSLFAAGDTLFITNIGAGACTITAGTATVSTASSLVLAQYDSGRLYFTSTGVAIWEKYQGAAASGGKVLQVVNATYGTEVSNSTTTYAATGLTATITPSATTSKILVIVNQNGLQKGPNNNFGHLELRRGATSILKFEEIYGRSIAQLNGVGGAGASYLDSPATTSATTYATYFKSEDTNIVYVNANASYSSITLLEIGA